MAFLKGIFGGNKTGGGAAGGGAGLPQQNYALDAQSISALLFQQKASLSPQRCGACGTTYLNPDWMFTLVTQEPQNFRLDVGGYCPRCSAYRCYTHARVQNVVRPSMRLPDQSLLPFLYGMVCGQCGATLQQGPGLPAGEHAMLVDGKLLAGLQKKPGVKQEFAAASGKISLAKVVENQHHLKLLDFTCGLCGAPYRHIPQLIAFGTSDGLTPEKFEVDVGGFCAQCGNICGRHIRIGEYVHEGKTLLAPLCATHGTLITPLPR
jgi:hypothetical protein